MKQKIQPSLKALTLNSEITFSSSYKYSVISAAIQTVQNDTEMHFRMKKNKHDKTVTVKRTF